MILKKWLRSQGLKVDDFAEKINVSRGAVLKWISGERYPRFEYLNRIYNETQGVVTPNDFFTNEKKIEKIKVQQSKING